MDASIEIIGIGSGLLTIFNPYTERSVLLLSANAIRFTAVSAHRATRKQASS